MQSPGRALYSETPLCATHGRLDDRYVCRIATAIDGDPLVGRWRGDIVIECVGTDRPAYDCRV